MQEHGPARSAITVSPAPLVEDGSASLGDGGLRLAACAVVLSTAVAQCGVPGLGWTARHEVREGLPLGLAVRGPLWRSYRATQAVGGTLKLSPARSRGLVSVSAASPAWPECRA